MTKVINLVGSPGVGKSLMSCLVFAGLKMRHIKAEYVQEFAKTLVWQNRIEELNNQWYVTSEQYKMIKPLDNQVDYIVCDSGLIIGLFYNENNEKNISNVEKTKDMILSKMKEFDNVYVYLERNDDFPFEEVGRIHDESQCKEMDIGFKQLLIDNNLPFKTFKSSIENVENIIDYVLSQ